MKSVFKILSLEIDNLKIEFKAEIDGLKSRIEALEGSKLSVDLIKSLSRKPNINMKSKLKTIKKPKRFKKSDTVVSNIDQVESCTDCENENIDKHGWYIKAYPE